MVGKVCSLVQIEVHDAHLYVAMGSSTWPSADLDLPVDAQHEHFDATLQQHLRLLGVRRVGAVTEQDAIWTGVILDRQRK